MGVRFGYTVMCTHRRSYERVMHMSEVRVCHHVRTADEVNMPRESMNRDSTSCPVDVDDTTQEAYLFFGEKKQDANGT